MYLKVDSYNAIESFPYSFTQLKQDNPNVSFPDNIKIENLEEFGIHHVNVVPTPEHNKETHKYVKNSMPSLIGDEWTLGGELVALSQEEMDISFNNAVARAKNRIQKEVQEKLDNFAKERDYNSAVSCVSYIDSADANFAADASHMILKRDQVWQAAISILADVQSKLRPIPESIEDIESELPALEWL